MEVTAGNDTEASLGKAVKTINGTLGSSGNSTYDNTLQFEKARSPMYVHTGKETEVNAEQLQKA